MRPLASALPLGILAAAIVAGEPPRSPDSGDPAPPFELKGSDGKSYSLADFAGKKAVVLAWFPKAFTGG